MYNSYFKKIQGETATNLLARRARQQRTMLEDIAEFTLTLSDDLTKGMIECLVMHSYTAEFKLINGEVEIISRTPMTEGVRIIHSEDTTKHLIKQMLKKF